MIKISYLRNFNIFFVFACNLSAQEPLDATNGIVFGPGGSQNTTDPKLEKSADGVQLNGGLLEIVGGGGVFGKYFRVGEGESKNIGNNASTWHRIATGERSGSGLFVLRSTYPYASTDTVGGVLVFRLGVHHNRSRGVSLTVLQNSARALRSGQPFTAIRVVMKDLPDEGSGSVDGSSEFYLDVKTGNQGYVLLKSEVYENLSVGGWAAEDWVIVPEAPPAGYKEYVYNIRGNVLDGGEVNFMVGSAFDGNPTYTSINRLGDIETTGQISSDGGINAGGNVSATSITSGGDVTVGGQMKSAAGGPVVFSDGIQVQGDITATGTVTFVANSNVTVNLNSLNLTEPSGDIPMGPFTQQPSQ